METAASVIPVLVVTPDRQSYNSLEPVISLFVDGVRQLPLNAQAPKTNIAIADLVGEWRSGGDSSLNYVTSSGAYAGSSTVAHGASYTIASNGSYKSQFAGVTNRQIVRGSSVGTVELGSGTIGFRERGGKLSRYHLFLIRPHSMARPCSRCSAISTKPTLPMSVFTARSGCASLNSNPTSADEAHTCSSRAKARPKTLN